MDKMLFLATLAGKLSEYPISSEDIEKNVAMIKAHIDKVSDAEFAADPATDADVAEIAKELYEKHLAEKAREEELAAEQAEIEAARAEAAETEAEAEAAVGLVFDGAEEGFAISDQGEVRGEDEPPAPEEIIERLEQELPEESEPQPQSDDDFFDMLAREADKERAELARIEELELKALAMANKDDPEAVAQVLGQDEKLVEMVAASDIADEFDPIEEAVDPQVRPDIAFKEAEINRVFEPYEEDATPDLMVNKDKLKHVDEEFSYSPISPRHKKEKVKGTPLFWTLFILTLPITLPLFLVVCALFGVAYVGVTAVISVLSVAMVCTVAVGTALALVGIIFGVTKCMSVLAVGLFEIGLGIAIGGATMLIAILLYNIAIRFAPRLYKLIGRFGKYVFAGLGELYTKIKKECGKK